MNYEERIAIIKPWIAEMVGRFDRPNHLIHDKARAELQDMAEDLNYALPAALNKDQLDGTLERTARSIRMKQRTRTWPTIQMVVSCARESLPQDQQPRTAAIQSPSLEITDRINARRIKSGEPVAESCISGTGAERLIGLNLVTPQDLESYRRSIAERVNDRDLNRHKPVEDVDDLDLEEITW